MANVSLTQYVNFILVTSPVNPEDNECDYNSVYLLYFHIFSEKRIMEIEVIYENRKIRIIRKQRRNNKEIIKKITKKKLKNRIRHLFFFGN